MTLDIFSHLSDSVILWSPDIPMEVQSTWVWSKGHNLIKCILNMEYKRWSALQMQPSIQRGLFLVLIKSIPEKMEDTERRGSAGMVVMGWWLHLMILGVFSNLNDYIILEDYSPLLYVSLYLESFLLCAWHKTHSHEYPHCFYKPFCSCLWVIFLPHGFAVLCCVPLAGIMKFHIKTCSV